MKKPKTFVDYALTPTSRWRPSVARDADSRRATARTGAHGGTHVDDGAGSVLGTAAGVASLAGTALGAYHGYKRNDSIGWGIAWGLLGGAFPIIVIPVALAQGFGTRKK